MYFSADLTITPLGQRSWVSRERGRHRTQLVICAIASRSRRFSQPVSTMSIICSAASSIASRSLYDGAARRPTGGTLRQSRLSLCWHDRDTRVVSRQVVEIDRTHP
jgi:hypothetical protein